MEDFLTTETLIIELLLIVIAGCHCGSPAAHPLYGSRWSSSASW